MQLDSSITAVVTGGASGLGEATARRLAAAGVRVALFDLDETRGAAIAQELGGVFCRVDVTSDDAVRSGFEKARSALGQERILVNCAGIVSAGRTASRAADTGEVRRFPPALFDKLIQVNLVGTYRCIAESAAGMLDLETLADGERGVIINTASIAAEDGQIGQAAYAASKAGVAGMTLPIARDLMDRGIRVNTILPGVFATAMMGALAEPAVHALEASIPFPKRLGNPAEYAALAEAMIVNAYFNGACVRLDAALRMGPR